LSSMHMGNGGHSRRGGRRRQHPATGGAGGIAVQRGHLAEGIAADKSASQNGMPVESNPARPQAGQHRADTGPARHDSSLAMASAGISTRSGTISGGGPEHSNTVST
jgi:hypothetical protein